MARLCHVFLPKETSPLRSQADWPSSVAGKLKRAQWEVSWLQAANDRFQSRRVAETARSRISISAEFLHQQRRKLGPMLFVGAALGTNLLPKGGCRKEVFDPR